MQAKQVRQAQGCGILQEPFLCPRHGPDDHELGVGWGCGGEEGEEGVEEGVGDLDVLTHLDILHQSVQVVQDDDGCV